MALTVARAPRLLNVLGLSAILAACGGSAAAPPSSSASVVSAAEPARSAASKASASPVTSQSASVAGGGAPSSSAARAASPKPTLVSGFRDFDIVTYQGEDVIGGPQTKFSAAFGPGRPVVLNFWAGLCPPCRAEMPGFNRIAEQQKGKVTFVGVDVGPFVQLGNHEDAIMLYTSLGIQYPLGYAVNAQPLRLYSVQGMPTTIFFRANGQMLNKVSGLLVESQMASEVQKLLASG